MTGPLFVPINIGDYSNKYPNQGIFYSLLCYSYPNVSGQYVMPIYVTPTTDLNALRSELHKQVNDVINAVKENQECK